MSCMSNVKNGALREIVIDRCLHDRRGHSTLEIMEKCNAALESRGEERITSSNTIRNDMDSISNRWYVNIEQVRDGRNIRYRYEDPDFSIYNSPLSADELMQLSESVSLLRRFEGMSGFEWVDELNAHLMAAVNVKAEPFVGFDSNSGLKGMEFFTPLFNSIASKLPVSICYRPFGHSECSELVVHPYYLKEYNQRWFLFGRTEGRKGISTFALDRIESVKASSGVKFVENSEIDFSHYFDEIVGVSFCAGGTSVDVELMVDKEQLPYILSKPIHRSQKTVGEFSDGGGIVSLHVQPNFELKQLLLSFGERVTVLSPVDLRDEIISRLKKSLEKYESVQKG